MIHFHEDFFWKKFKYLLSQKSSTLRFNIFLSIIEYMLSIHILIEYQNKDGRRLIIQAKG